MCPSTLRTNLRNPIASITTPAMTHSVPISCSTFPVFPHVADENEQEKLIAETVVCKTHPVAITRNPMIIRVESRNRIQRQLRVGRLKLERSVVQLVVSFVFPISH